MSVREGERERESEKISVDIQWMSFLFLHHSSIHTPSTSVQWTCMPAIDPLKDDIQIQRIHIDRYLKDNVCQIKSIKLFLPPLLCVSQNYMLTLRLG